MSDKVVTINKKTNQTWVRTEEGVGSLVYRGAGFWSTKTPFLTPTASGIQIENTFTDSVDFTCTLPPSPPYPRYSTSEPPPTTFSSIYIAEGTEGNGSDLAAVGFPTAKSFMDNFDRYDLSGLGNAGDFNFLKLQSWDSSIGIFVTSSSVDFTPRQSNCYLRAYPGQGWFSNSPLEGLVTLDSNHTNITRGADITERNNANYTSGNFSEETTIWKSRTRYYIYFDNPNNKSSSIFFSDVSFTRHTYTYTQKYFTLYEDNLFVSTGNFDQNMAEVGAKRTRDWYSDITLFPVSSQDITYYTQLLSYKFDVANYKNANVKLFSGLQMPIQVNLFERRKSDTEKEFAEIGAEKEWTIDYQIEAHANSSITAEYKFNALRTQTRNDAEVQLSEELTTYKLRSEFEVTDINSSSCFSVAIDKINHKIGIITASNLSKFGEVRFSKTDPFWNELTGMKVIVATRLNPSDSSDYYQTILGYGTVLNYTTIPAYNGKFDSINSSSDKMLQSITINITNIIGVPWDARTQYFISNLTYIYSNNGSIKDAFNNARFVSSSENELDIDPISNINLVDNILYKAASDSTLLGNSSKDIVWYADQYKLTGENVLSCNKKEQPLKGLLRQLNRPLSFEDKTIHSVSYYPPKKQ